MRCPDCNKFVSNEQAEPELEINAELEFDGEKPAAASLSGQVRLVLTCGECSTELAEANPDFDFDVTLEHQEAEEHEVEIDGESAEACDRYDGKPGTPSRYRRHFYGADITGKITCSCGAAADFSHTVEEQAGGFDQLC